MDGVALLLIVLPTACLHLAADQQTGEAGTLRALRAPTSSSDPLAVPVNRACCTCTAARHPSCTEI